LFVCLLNMYIFSISMLLKKEAMFVVCSRVRLFHIFLWYIMLNYNIILLHSSCNEYIFWYHGAWCLNRHFRVLNTLFELSLYCTCRLFHSIDRTLHNMTVIQITHTCSVCVVPNAIMIPKEDLFVDALRICIIMCK